MIEPHQTLLELLPGIAHKSRYRLVLETTTTDDEVVNIDSLVLPSGRHHHRRPICRQIVLTSLATTLTVISLSRPVRKNV